MRPKTTLPGEGKSFVFTKRSNVDLNPVAAGEVTFTDCVPLKARVVSTRTDPMFAATVQGTGGLAPGVSVSKLSQTNVPLHEPSGPPSPGPMLAPASLTV